MKWLEVIQFITFDFPAEGILQAQRIYFSIVLLNDMSYKRGEQFLFQRLLGIFQEIVFIERKKLFYQWGKGLTKIVKTLDFLLNLHLLKTAYRVEGISIYSIFEIG